MLIKFSVRNYLSFKEENSLDLSAEALKEKKGNIHIPYLYNPKLTVLKSAVIYGYNAFGKSNLIKAYSFFQNFIITSFTLGKMQTSIDVEPFRLNTFTKGKPSYFEIIFILKNIKYRYGFEVTDERVVSEWLHYAEGNIRENTLFTRSGQEFREISKLWNKESASRIEQAKFFTKPQNLFLSVLLEQDNIPRVDKIALWFKGNIILKGNYGEATNGGAAQIYTKTDYRTTILKFLKNSDLGFESIFEKVANFVSKKGMHQDVANFLFEIEMTNFELFTHHNLYDEQYFFQKIIEFNLIKNESTGSIKYFIVACFLAYAIKNGQLIWIDELDASLHSQLISFLVKIFNNEKNNLTGSQMIFTCHNTVMLKNKLRRDQIWIVDKNKFGESTLFKAHTAKTPIRINKSIEQDYLEGNIGVSKKAVESNIPNLFDGV